MRLILPELQGSGKRNRRIALLGPWLIFIAICGAIAALFSVVTTQGVGVSTGYTDGLFYCDTSDKIRYAYADNAFDKSSPYWDGNLFLSVTMGFHGLTFPQAKAIDICFDLVVGRGSQVLLALATYPLLRRAVLRSMEVRDFSLALLLPFFTERLSAYTLWAMTANMRIIRKKAQGPEPGQQIARSRIRARGKPFFPVDDGSSYMSAEGIKFPQFFVRGSEQIGLTPDYALYNNSDPQLYATLSGYYEASNQTSELYREDWTTFNSKYSSYFVSAYNYYNLPTQTFSDERIAQLLEVELLFNKTRASLPLQQNITDPKNPPTWSYTLWPRNATWGKTRYPTRLEDLLDSTIVVRNTTYNIDTSLTLYSNTDPQGNADSTTQFVWGSQNISVRGEDLAAIGVCLPSKDYVWGFSSLMLFTFCMFTVAVLLLLIVLHYDAYFNSMADRYKLQISPYRDVLDLAEELRSHYGETEVASMPARELDKAMQLDPATAGLETATLHKTRAARWRQSSSRPRIPTWTRLRGDSEVAESSRTDAEVSLMSIGFDAHGSDFKMGKLPAKTVTKQFD
ncbi:hypothetical protein MBLNU13_g02047t1 [Cladosporium sp. NU13]